MTSRPQIIFKKKRINWPDGAFEFALKMLRTHTYQQVTEMLQEQYGLDTNRKKVVATIANGARQRGIKFDYQATKKQRDNEQFRKGEGVNAEEMQAAPGPTMTDIFQAFGRRTECGQQTWTLDGRPVTFNQLMRECNRIRKNSGMEQNNRNPAWCV